MESPRCPPPKTLGDFALGKIASPEAERLEEHLAQCADCAATLDGLAVMDTLAQEVASAGKKAALPEAEHKVVEQLMARMAKLPGPGSFLKERPGPRIAMISIRCTACQKKLSVKEALAGKKVKCPGCGLVIPVVARAAVPAGNEVTRTLAPVVEVDIGARPTDPPLSQPDATKGPDEPGGQHDSSLTDFLAPPQADDELGRLGDYRILKILGHGGMGVVFMAEDPKLKRRVAIKAMLPTLAASASAGKRFLREAQSMAAVEHPHIVRIHQVAEEQGVPFLVMEFLKGEPLDERLKRDEEMPIADVLRIGREIAQGLDAAHETGLIHRDIKPANIWLESGHAKKAGDDGARTPPCVKILDFGLARAGAQDATLTQQGVVVGTPAFMAPEQARGGNVDARCDLFSLGVVLYRLCTGQQPFQATDSVSMLMAVAMHEPTPPIGINTELPPELSDLVMRLLEKDHEKRIGSAGEVVMALQKMEKQLARETEAEALNPAPPRLKATDRKKQGGAAAVDAGPSVSRKRSQRALVIAVALLLLLVPFGWLYGGVIFRFATNQGELIIEVHDPAIEVNIVQNDVVIHDKTNKREFTLTAGKGEIHVLEKDGIKLPARQFELTRGGKTTVKVTLEELADARKKDPGPAVKKAPPTIVTSTDPDRRAAEWVLSIGSKISIKESGKEREIKAATAT